MPTVLCIDDESQALRLRKLLLESKGYSVLTAENGLLGLELLSSNTVDAVLLDYKMQPMNGLEVAKKIRLQHGAWIPILLLTGFLGEIPTELLYLFDACLTKGNPTEMLEQLQRLLKHRRTAGVYTQWSRTSCSWHCRQHNRCSKRQVSLPPQ